MNDRSTNDLWKDVGKTALGLAGWSCIACVCVIGAGALTTAMFGAGPVGGTLALAVAYGGVGAALYKPLKARAVNFANAWKTVARRLDPRVNDSPNPQHPLNPMQVRETQGKSFRKMMAYAGAMAGLTLFGAALSFIGCAGFLPAAAIPAAIGGYKVVKALKPGLKTHFNDWRHNIGRPFEGDRVTRVDQPERPGQREQDLDYDSSRVRTSVSRPETTPMPVQTPRPAVTPAPQSASSLKETLRVKKEIPALNITINNLGGRS